MDKRVKRTDSFWSLIKKDPFFILLLPFVPIAFGLIFLFGWALGVGNKISGGTDQETKTSKDDGNDYSATDKKQE